MQKLTTPNQNNDAGKAKLKNTAPNMALIPCERNERKVQRVKEKPVRGSGEVDFFFRDSNFSSEHTPDYEQNSHPYRDNTPGAIALL